MVGQVVDAVLADRVPRGREQGGRRPCVVVGDFTAVGRMRFPMVLVVPLTSASPPREVWAKQGGALYPLQPAGSGAGAIGVDSYALLDQLTSIDATRAMRLRGTLSEAEMRPILDGLRRAIGG